MTREMTSAQITEWMAFYRMEPFTADRIEYLFGQLMYMYATANRGKGKKPKLDQFMPFLIDQKEDWELVDEYLEKQGPHIDEIRREEIAHGQ